MDSFLKGVFVRAGKHTSFHDAHPHKNCGLVVIPIILGENYNQLCSTTNDFFTVHVVLVISS